ncbi:MAG: hypothetical protein KC492_40480, partial [Myxococcales bacterium]|nr:hypothetical protein [Myxococcales bacterium]
TPATGVKICSTRETNHAIEFVPTAQSLDPFFSQNVLASLVARRAFVELRDASRQVLEPELSESLQRAAATLSDLEQGDWYPMLRSHDRTRATRLAARIRRWLITQPTASARRKGAKLLKRYFDFVETCMGVNRRPELVEHDVRVLREALRASATEPVSKVRSLAMAALGRDEDLDRLLLGSTRQRVVLRCTIERTLQNLAAESPRAVRLTR